MNLEFSALMHYAKDLVNTQTSIHDWAIALPWIRGAEVAARFATATPIDKGLARSSWRVVYWDAWSVAVINTATNKGFPYPAALITGTGRRGVSTPGYAGQFNTSWAGMVPNSALRSAWIDEAHKPFAVPRLAT